VTTGQVQILNNHTSGVFDQLGLNSYTVYYLSWDIWVPWEPEANAETIINWHWRLIPSTTHGQVAIGYYATLAVSKDKADITHVSQWWLMLSKEFDASQNLS
jgi:hypothetical protein